MAERDDFFFDDEEQATAAAKQQKPKTTPKKTAGSSPSAGKKSSAAGAQAAVVPVEGFSFSTMVVVLVAVIALLVGVLGGIFIGRGMNPPIIQASDTASSGGSTMGGMGDTGTDGSGMTDMGSMTGTDTPQELPAGHPDISNMPTSTGE